MSSEEEDYMSDAVLQQCGDKRPGLVSSRVAKLHNKEEKHKAKNLENAVKPKKQLETEKREEGLKSAISSDNKGFALLAKMGYKPGMTIGKKGEGRAEPVPIEIRLGRGGLGHDKELKRKADSYAAARSEALKKSRKLEAHRKETFLQRMSDRYTENQTKRDLVKSQKVCVQLDQQQDIESPAKTFFWPKYCLKAEEDNETLDDSEDNTQQKSVPKSSNYDNHDDDDDFEDHDEEEDYDDDDIYSEVEKLQLLTQYLREHHIYCVWCGTRYDDAEDMTANCPGDTADAHDD